MPFALIRFEKIIIDKAFAESLAAELKSNQISDGTISLVTNEILLDPTYVFGYNNQSGVRFPGRYHVVLVADHLDSGGGEIDLTW